jgi:hypothetical protein
MRIGYNPHKDKQTSKSDYLHQIVIPVYIPNHKGYFKDSLTILKICLESLFVTSHNKTYITIVNNGSCKEVTNYLNELFLNEQIHEIVTTTNIGKLNAILKGIIGHNFSLITIADSDVMFLNDWQKATYSVFESFPKTGAVCPTPSSRSLRTHTANIYWDMFFSKHLLFSKIENHKALKMFGESVGNPDFYNKVQLQKYLTVTNKNQKAVIGAGHFAATYRGDIFENINIKYSNYKLGGDSENKILDIPVVKKGFWRLSTVNNYAYHMGNTLEDWMKDEVRKIINQEQIDSVILRGKPNNSKILYFIKNRLFAKFILNKKILKLFLLIMVLKKRFQ